jgi:hypothetical protein
MFTLFFGGEVFAPKAKVRRVWKKRTWTTEGKSVVEETRERNENVGWWLREGFLSSMEYLASRLKHIECVLGFDVINEPHPGFIGLESLNEFNQDKNLHLGPMPTPLESMGLAAGLPTKVDVYTRSFPRPTYPTRTILLNQERLCCWKYPKGDIWLNEDVYKIEDGKAVLGAAGKTYFTSNPATGEEIIYERDFYQPFVSEYSRRITSALSKGRSSKWIFVEPVPNEGSVDPASLTEEAAEIVQHADGVALGERQRKMHTSDTLFCYAPHWYDLRVLFEKRFWYPVNLDVLALASVGHQHDLSELES